MRKLILALLLGFSVPMGPVAAAPSGMVAPHIRNIVTRDKVIALTIDDGPSPQATPLLLDILKREHVKATFFLIGQEAAKYPDIVAREVADGHEIANHGMHHKSMDRIKEAEMREDIRDGAIALKKAGAPPPRLYRFPKALYSKTALRVLGEMGYTVVGWSVDVRDYQPRAASGLIADTLRETNPGDILLFHDGPGERQATLKALSTIIPQLKARGFRFVTVSGLMALSRAKA